MKRLMFVGRAGSGKTSFSQAMRGLALSYLKTQDICFSDDMIDLPGEYLENRVFHKAFMVTACEADVVLFFQDATDENNSFPELFAHMFPVPVYGLVTKIDVADQEMVERAYQKLKTAGCGEIFPISNVTGQGIKLFQQQILG